MAERKYQLTKLEAGDYVFVGNDDKRVWRIKRYTDGDSGGLDWEGDREVWGVWQARRPITAYLDNSDALAEWDEWEMTDGPLPTRKAAIDTALEA